VASARARRARRAPARAARDDLGLGDARDGRLEEDGAALLDEVDGFGEARQRGLAPVQRRLLELALGDGHKVLERLGLQVGLDEEARRRVVEDLDDVDLIVVQRPRAVGDGHLPARHRRLVASLLGIFLIYIGNEP
jgi:hypothetical protein